MKSIFLFVLIWVTSFCGIAQTLDLLVGSSANTGKDGIYIYSFDPVTAEVTLKSKLSVNRPTYTSFSPDKRFLYAITEGANISSFRFSPSAGGLTLINKQSSGGQGPIHISTEKTGRFLFTANYDSGSLAVLPVQADGSLMPVTQVLLQSGRSIDSIRQTKPYVHSVVPTPDNRFLIAADLGTDKINIFHIDLRDSLTPLKPSGQGAVNMIPGSGPRFFIFDRRGTRAYVVQELNGMITAFDYDGAALTAFQSASMLAPGFAGRSGAADLHISPDGKYLYATNRGDANEVVIFSIADNGSLTYAGRYQSPVKRPRYFAIDPSGSFLLLTHQGSDDVTILKRDQVTGLLSDTGKIIPLAKPVCLEFAD